MLQPYDGISLLSLFQADQGRRGKPLGFRHSDRGVLIDNEYKYIIQKGKEELYHLENDFAEKENLAAREKEILTRMQTAYREWNATVVASVEGKDYPGGKLDPNQPERRFWNTDPAYRPYLESWKDRWEYKSWVQRALNPKSAKKNKKKTK